MEPKKCAVLYLRRFNRSGHADLHELHECADRAAAERLFQELEEQSATGSAYKIHTAVVLKGVQLK